MQKNESINIYQALLLDYLKVLYKIVLCFFQVSNDNALRAQIQRGRFSILPSMCLNQSHFSYLNETSAFIWIKNFK